MPASGRSLLATVLALAAASAAVQGDGDGVPACAVRDFGYEDPAVPRVNGGIEVQDAQTCQNLCKGLIGCKVFTFYINSGGCWLQGLSGTLPERRPIQGVWSGPAHCASASNSDSALSAGSSSNSAAAADEFAAIVAGGEEATTTPKAEEVITVPSKERNTTKEVFTVLPDGPAEPILTPSEKAASDAKGDVPLPLKVLSTILIAILVLLAAYACCHKAKAEKNPYRRKRGVELDVEEGSPTSARSPGSPGSEASWVNSGSPKSRAGEVVDEVVEEPNHPAAAPLGPQGLLSGAPPMVPMMYQQHQHHQQQQPFMYPGLNPPQPASFVAPYSGMYQSPQQRQTVMEPTQVQRPVVQEPLQQFR